MFLSLHVFELTILGSKHIFRKLIILIGVSIILLSAGLSGCVNNSEPPEITLPDGTKVTGDTDLIQIVTHQIVKKKYLELRSTSDNSEYTSVFREEVPYELNISDITVNFSKRKDVCDAYFSTNYWVIWNENYTGFTHTNGLLYRIDEFYTDNNVSVILITGSAKNIGEAFLTSAVITVNFYNMSEGWLTSEKTSGNNIPSGYTKDFRIDYRGEFLDDVQSISFKLEARTIG